MEIDSGFFRVDGLNTGLSVSLAWSHRVTLARFSEAGIAQLVEQLLRKQLVGGSSPLSGTKSSPLKQS